MGLTNDINNDIMYLEVIDVLKNNKDLKMKLWAMEGITASLGEELTEEELLRIKSIGEMVCFKVYQDIILSDDMSHNSVVDTKALLEEITNELANLLKEDANND